jgi:hypothetical protein
MEKRKRKKTEIRFLSKKIKRKMSSYGNVNFELITLIWVDSMVNSTQENREIQDKLRSIVNYLLTFDNCQECEEYIISLSDHQQDKIILIVSGKLGQELIAKIHHFKQIISIFVFCGNKQMNQLWSNNHQKVFIFYFFDFNYFCVV